MSPISLRNRGHLLVIAVAKAIRTQRLKSRMQSRGGFLRMCCTKQPLVMQSPPVLSRIIREETSRLRAAARTNKKTS